ncbi:MAG: hypothetical protein J6C23_07900 [Clostridia bacterium]|nr:hypothetical protein [Clostridia bacterium]
MTIADLISRMRVYMIGETERSFADDQMAHYQNDYITLRRIASSNKWVGVNKLTKQWSIVYLPHKDFTCLNNYRELKKHFDIRITSVSKGDFKGCYGVRIYGMTKNPDRKIVKELLDFIFE